MGGGRQPKSIIMVPSKFAAPYRVTVSFQGVFDGIVLRHETCSGTSVSGPYVAGTLVFMLASNSNFLNNPPLKQFQFKKTMPSHTLVINMVL